MSAKAASRPAVWRGVAAFAPMCAISALSWAELVDDPPAGRVVALVALATTCGLILSLSARLEPDGRTEARIVRVITVALALVVGPVVAGVSPELLAPGGWGALLEGLSRGVDGLPTTWPYEGSDLWVRTTVLLAIPVMTIPAAAFALWPPAEGPGGPEAAAVRRVGALLLLLSLIGFAGSERALADPLLRGALLLLALVAWLFLPRLHGRVTGALGAGAAVLVAAVASLPLATALAPGPGVKEGSAGEPRGAPPAARGGGDGERPRSRPDRDREEERRSEGGADRRDRPDPPEREQPPERPDPSQRPEADQPSPLVLVALIAALVAAVVVGRRVLRSRVAGDEAEELRRALERLGWSVPPKTTLAELEATLSRGAGPAAARYARRLRERRFALPGTGPPAGLDRRALRSDLTAGHGPRVRLRGLIALPPAALTPRR